MSKKVINVISVLFAVALMIIVFALLLTTYSAVQKDAYEEMDFLYSVLLMLTSSFGIYYVLAGCKKGEGSRYYVWFMGALAVCDLIAIASSASPTVNLFLAVSDKSFSTNYVAYSNRNNRQNYKNHRNYRRCIFRSTEKHYSRI